MIGIVLGALGWNSWLALVGWALAGPMAIGVMAYFVQKDAARRADPNYLIQLNMNVYYVGAALSAVVGILVTAVGAAFWVGHL